MSDQNHMAKVHMLEQTLQSFSSQKQQLQAQLLEIESAKRELVGKENAYSILGSIMVQRSTVDINKDLDEKKELITTRMGMIEKQEEKTMEKLKELQGGSK